MSSAPPNGDEVGWASRAVRGAALANRRYFKVEKSALYATQGRASAAEWARGAEEAGVQLAHELAYYNEKLAGGKWRHMMSMEMKSGQWPSMRTIVLKLYMVDPGVVVDRIVVDAGGLKPSYLGPAETRVTRH